MSAVEVSEAHTGLLQFARTSAVRLGQWWLSGLRKAVPQHWLKWADGENRSVVSMSRDGDAMICRLASSGAPVEARFPVGGFGTNTLTQWLADQQLTRDSVIVQPILAQELFFLRQMNVPRAALPALPKILEQELLRRTPFRPDDVWHGGTVAGDGASDPAVICHWIIRRDRAAAALADFGLGTDDVDALAVAEEIGGIIPAINLRADVDEDPAWALRLSRLLAAAGIAAIVLGMLIFEWNQASVAASIEQDLAEARQTAQSGREAIDPAARLFALKAEVGVLDVLEELSRILPDHTFLTEANVSDGKVVIAGLSADAARLVRIIDQSPLFSGAALTAAITPDATEHKERFAISFKVKGARLLKRPGAARNAP
jgi:general secretion pathway protein L